MTEWSGSWVRQALGVRMTPGPGCALSDVERFVGLALRRNPRRAHLLVSTVLGKHVPVSPSLAIAAGADLGRRVAELFGRSMGEVLVLGFAETATALGHLVADELGATYVHSTRRRAETEELGFDEVHSHATRHHLVASRSMIEQFGPLVLVDDELSTGATAAATIRALHAIAPRSRYVVATLVDARDRTDILDRLATELGAPVDVVAAVSCRVAISGAPDPEVARLVATATPEPEAAGAWEDALVHAQWPEDLPTGAAGGFLDAARPAFGAAIATLAGRVRAAVPSVHSLHVLGTEELMYLPLRLAEALEAMGAYTRVTFSSTTRSPVVVLDEPGYAVRSGMSFAAHDEPDDGPGARFVYNLESDLGAVVVVLDDRSEPSQVGGLLTSLETVTDLVVPVVVPMKSRPSS